MIRRPGRDEEDKPKVPGWIVSFTDMITLLLSFFVLLQSLAEVRDPELFFEGQGSFVRAIRTFGLPGFMTGEKAQPKRDFTKVRHPTDTSDQERPVNRLIDARDEKIRKAFDELRRAVEVGVEAEDLPERTLQATVTPIRFARRSVRLDAEADLWLQRFAADLASTGRPDRSGVRVVALAPDAEEDAARWMLSARRSEAVARRLRGLLEEGGRAVSAWGAGAGEGLARRLGADPNRTFVLILVEAER
jgi:flagellar motor protein MotB